MTTSSPNGKSVWFWERTTQRSRIAIVVSVLLLSSAIVIQVDSAVSPAAADDLEAEPVDVGQRVITPEDNVGGAELGGSFYVQFSSRLTDQEIEDLKAGGVAYGQALHANTYILRLDRGASTTLRAHPKFVGLASVLATDKSASAQLLEPPDPAARAIAEPQPAMIEFYPGVTLDEALAAADASGVVVPDRSGLFVGSRLAVFGLSTQLATLASYSGVLFVNEPAGEPETHNLVAQQLSNVDDVQAIGLDGSGVIMGLWDGGPTLATHGDFGARVAVNDFNARLEGPNDPNGVGSATISLQGTTLKWFANGTNISQPTATNIYSGAAGQTGAVYISLPNAYILSNGTYFGGGSVTITTAQAAALRANPDQFYFNIHTAAYPSGAIRGQFLVSDYHATHVGGTMIGSGAGNASAEGMAPGAPVLQSYDFQGDTPSELTYAATSQGIQIANHSWGTTVGRCSSGWCGDEGRFGLYTGQTRAYDNMVAATGLINVKSSGNDRNNCGSRPEDPDNCDGVLGADGEYYDNIPTFGNAKNVITVGALNDDGTTIAGFSSAGPANDGRIKPDVVANGVGLLSPWNGEAEAGCSDGVVYCSISGTSMSTPTVSGIVALLQQRYAQLTGGSTMSPAVAKAVLANTATDLGRPGPDYLYGYGLVDAQAAMSQLEFSHLQQGLVTASAANDPLGQRDLDTYSINVSAGTADLRVTLSWVDLAGVAQSDDANNNPTTPAIVNQLDVTLRDPNGVTYYPFSGPGRGNPTGVATAAGPNRIDTLQQVRVANPAVGQWTMVVRGYDNGDQFYAVVTSETSCPDDDFEDLAGNDSSFFATSIAEGQTINGRVCDSDSDYYKFPVVAGEEILVETLFIHGDGDIDMVLYDPNGIQVGIANSTSDDESLTHTALASGEYQVQIYGYLGANNSNYDLTAWTGSCPRNDTFEDNDTQATASPTAYGNQVSALVCDNDSDFYSFPVSAGDKIFARAIFDHSLTDDIDMRLFAPDGTLVANATSSSDNESILHSANTSGDYALELYGFSGAETPYDLEVLNGICSPDDALEDNDTQATATTLSNGEVVSAILCAGDLDWFEISAAPGDLITVNALFEHSLGDLDLELFDPTGASVEISGSADDNESVTHLASLLGNYAIRVNEFGGSENIYDVAATAQPFSCGTGPWSAPTAGLLNVAIECFNSAQTSGTYTINVTANITLTSATSQIFNNIGAANVSLQVNGMGHTIDADGNGRVFQVNTSEVEFVNITLTGGNAVSPNENGGGLYNFGGTVSLTDATITGNDAARGGGVYTDQGTTIISGSTISNNTSSSTGGGLSHFQGTTTVIGSTISDNTAGAHGGGIINSVGTMTVTDSTISGNDASLDGGGIYNGAAITLNNSTISGNSAGSDGGGIANYRTMNLWFSTVAENDAPLGAGIWTLDNAFTFSNLGASIVADNTGLGGDVDCRLGSCTGNGFDSEGFNVIGDGNATGQFAATQDTTIGAGAGLSPRQDNGGATETHLPTAGSPAIDRFTITAGLPTWDQPSDQRGIGRPQGPFKDAGSVEAPPAAPEQVTLNAPTGSGTSSTPEFVWTEDTNATHYRLWIQSLTGAGVVHDIIHATGGDLTCTAGTCTITPTGLTLTNDTYRWWVQAQSPAGNAPWSTHLDFSTQPPAVTPAQVTLNAPTGSGTSSTPEFVWTEDTNATHYRLWIQSLTGAGVVHDIIHATGGDLTCTAGTCTITPTGLTLTNDTYRWWVQAQSPAGNAPWSTHLDFSTQPPAVTPAQVTLNAPTGSGTSSTPEFVWTEDTNATHYRLWIQSLTGAGVVHDIIHATGGDLTCTAGTCTITPTGLTLTNDTYRWWVQAQSPAGNAPWSTHLDFSTQPPAVTPAQVTLNAPTGSGTSSTPEFVWTEDTNATHYRLWIQSLTGAGVVHDIIHATGGDLTCTAGTCTITPTGLTLTNDTYRWWVQAQSPAGNAPWSTHLDFSTG